MMEERSHLPSCYNVVGVGSAPVSVLSHRFDFMQRVAAFGEQFN